MPMYNEGYTREPSDKEMADKKVQELYAEYIHDKNLFADLEAAEAELADHKARYEAAKAVGALSDDQEHAVAEYLFYAEKDLKQTRLMIEQLDRASRGEAFAFKPLPHE